MVCESSSEKYFEKKYVESPLNINLTVCYQKCKNCGLVFSETHRNMNKKMWEELNYKFHHNIEKNHENRNFNQPPYIDIALALHILDKNKIIDLKNCLDYAAGYGTLAGILNKYFSHTISTYDKYINVNNIYRNENLLSQKYQTVINTAFFEHVLNRSSLDEVVDLVKDNGSLVMHTFVAESIPCDPNWFYLEPITHTTFFTNQSMKLLMTQWGFECSIYIPKAKIWVLFQKKDNIKQKIEAINYNFQEDYIIYSESFCCFWTDNS